MSVCCHFYSQCGQGMQCVEGSGVHGGDLVVIERQETYRAQAHKAAVTHTADAVTPQHTTHIHMQKQRQMNTVYSTEKIQQENRYL